MKSSFGLNTAVALPIRLKWFLAITTVQGIWTSEKGWKEMGGILMPPSNTLTTSFGKKERGCVDAKKRFLDAYGRLLDARMLRMPISISLEHWNANDEPFAPRLLASPMLEKTAMSWRINSRDMRSYHNNIAWLSNDLSGPLRIEDPKKGAAYFKIVKHRFGRVSDKAMKKGSLETPAGICMWSTFLHKLMVGVLILL